MAMLDLVNQLGIQAAIVVGIADRWLTNLRKDGLLSDPMGLQVEADLLVWQDLHLGI